jgi:hypothetical protein
MKPSVIVIIGRARAGKTTFAEWYQKIYGGKIARTSDVVYEVMAKARNCNVEDLQKLPKEELRPNLIKLADFLCDVQPDFLSKALIQRGINVIDGVRRVSELEELRKQAFVTTYYVYRREGTVDDNFAIPHTEADFFVDNNYGINKFKVREADDEDTLRDLEGSANG